MIEILNGKKILVVDDEPDLREPIAEELTYLGCTVFQAQGGNEALDILKRESIDAIISDVRMPQGDGVQLLKSVKRLNHAFPVLMLITGYTDLPKDEAYNLGAEAILAKPFDLDSLINELAKMLTPPVVRLDKSTQFLEATQNNPLHAYQLPARKFPDQATLGRGGSFLQLDSPLPGVSAAVTFTILIANEGTEKLSGNGIVRWIRAEESAGLGRGVGIEFVKLCDGLNSLINHVEQNQVVAFIPRNLDSLETTS